MNPDQIDKLFRDKLKNRHFEMNENSWEKMEAKIRADQRKKWLKFLIPALFLGLVAGICGFIKFGNSEAENSLGETPSKAIEHHETNASGKQELQENALQFDNEENQIDFTNENESSSEQVNGLQGTQDSKGLSHNKNSDVDTGSAEHRDNDGINPNTAIQGSEDQNNALFGLRNNPNTGANDGKVEINRKGDKENSLTGSTKDDPAHYSDNLSQNSSGNENKASGSQPLAENQNNNSFASIETTANSEIGNTENSSSSDELTLADMKRENLSGVSPSLELYDSIFEVKIPHVSNWKKEIGFFYGQSLINKNLTSNSAIWNEAVQFRNENESSVRTGEYGIEFSLSRNRLSLQTGLSSIQFGEEIAYPQGERDSLEIMISQETQYIDTTYVVNILDTAGMVIDTMVVTEILDSIIVTTVDSTLITYPGNLDLQNGKTSITYFEIPLQLGYSFRAGKWNFRPQAGVSYGLLRATKGFYIQNELDELIEISEIEVLRKNIWNALYGIRVSYAIDPNFNIQMQLGQRRNLNSIFETEDFLQKYRSSFVRLGVVYRF
ncbi:MAG: hypothetical protein AAF487_06540 [Bacteroidota bacterium]